MRAFSSNFWSESSLYEYIFKAVFGVKSDLSEYIEVKPAYMSTYFNWFWEKVNYKSAF